MSATPVEHPSPADTAPPEASSRLPAIDPQLVKILHRFSSGFVGHASTAKLSTIEFSPGSKGASATGADEVRIDLDVLEKDAERVRARLRVSYMSLLGWLPHDDLDARFVVSPAAMTERPSTDLGAHYVEALPGSEVEILEEKGEWVRVRLTSYGPCRIEYANAEGWLPKSAIGAIYKGSAAELDADGYIDASNEITGRKGRPVLAILTSELRAKYLGKEAGGRVEVIVDAGTATIRGFVPAHSFKAHPGFAGGCGMGIASPGSVSSPLPIEVSLDRYTCLFDSNDQLAGITTGPIDVTGRDEGGGIWTVRLPSPWGDLDLRVRESSGSPAAERFQLCPRP